MQLSRFADLQVCAFSTAASAVAEIDCAGADGVMFIGVPASSAARTWSMALKAGNSTAAFVNCASTHTHASSGAANHVIITDVVRPLKRWLGATFSSTTATPCYLLALKYSLRESAPTAFSATGGFVSAASGGIKRVISPSSAT